MNRKSGTSFTSQINSLTLADRPLVGGKAAALGALSSFGVRVPDGFVLRTEAFDRAIDRGALGQDIQRLLLELPLDSSEHLAAVSSTIINRILESGIPQDIREEIWARFEALGAEYVAVRSSASAEDGLFDAWAGQLESYLNTTTANLEENILRCWGSLFSPRALVYRSSKGLMRERLSVAVIVQRMIQSDSSGVAFSVHPTTHNRDRIFIEAGLGLGEAVVSGEVTPDRYTVSKRTRLVIERGIGRQTKKLVRDGGQNSWVTLSESASSSPKIENSTIDELVTQVLKIEKHFGVPVDIEWACEGRDLWIVQSRPITTVREVDRSSAYSFLSSTKLLKMGRFALSPLDLETWQAAKTTQYFAELFGLHRVTLNLCFKVDGIDYCEIYVPEEFVESLRDYVSSIHELGICELERKLKSFYSLRDRVRSEVPKLSVGDLSTLTMAELISRYQANRDLVHRVVVFDQFGWMSEHCWDHLFKMVLEERRGLSRTDSEYADTLLALIQPHEVSTTLLERKGVIEAAIAVINRERSLAACADDLVAKFSWLPLYAYGTPWGCEHYLEELSAVITTPVEELRRERSEIESYSERRDRRFAEATSKLKLTEREQQYFVDFGLALDARNEATHMISFCTAHLLPIYIEIARRLKISVEQLRQLSEEEVASALRGDETPAQILQRRRAVSGWGFNDRTLQKEVFSPSEAEEFLQRIVLEAGVYGSTHAGVGISASAGKVTGPVRITPTPQNNSRVGKGDILVTYSTTVDYLPAMKRAAGIITEVGGLTCHAAVIAREFGIPCIVGYPDAMSKLVDGEIVTLDADHGEIVRVTH